MPSLQRTQPLVAPTASGAGRSSFPNTSESSAAGISDRSLVPAGPYSFERVESSPEDREAVERCALTFERIEFRDLGLERAFARTLPIGLDGLVTDLVPLRDPTRGDRVDPR
jgi:hypothetical protein